jgi:hypothetical protein
MRDRLEKPDPSMHPSVIATAISQAIKAGRPRTRYAVGPLVKPFLFTRKWFGDRVFDWMLERPVVKQEGETA